MLLSVIWSVTPLKTQRSTPVQGRKIKRHKRVFKRQNEVVAPIGRDGLAREFGGEDGLEDLEGVYSGATLGRIIYSCPTWKALFMAAT